MQQRGGGPRTAHAKGSAAAVGDGGEAHAAAGRGVVVQHALKAIEPKHMQVRPYRRLVRRRQL
jgi:hypothetical protein